MYKYILYLHVTPELSGGEVLLSSERTGFGFDRSQKPRLKEETRGREPNTVSVPGALDTRKKLLSYCQVLYSDIEREAIQLVGSILLSLVYNTLVWLSSFFCSG